jgi:hypothetical protein
MSVIFLKFGSVEKKGFISAAGKAEEKTLELKKKLLFVRKKFKLSEHSLPRIVIDPTNEIQVSSENDFFPEAIDQTLYPIDFIIESNEHKITYDFLIKFNLISAIFILLEIF